MMTMTMRNEDVEPYLSVLKMMMTRWNDVDDKNLVRLCQGRRPTGREQEVGGCHVPGSHL